MQENERMVASNMKKRHLVCCYNIQQQEEEQDCTSKQVSESMPMLSRGNNSKIKFKNIEHNNRQPIYQLLNELYQNGSNSAKIYNLLTNKRINPVLQGSEDRDDLEYYIPQIVTYMVLQKNLTDEELITFVLNGCTTDFYFAHRVYFYLKSLSFDHMNQRICRVWDFINQRFINQMQIYEKCRLSGIEFTKSMIQMDSDFKAKKLFGDEVNEYEQQGECEQKEIEEIVTERMSEDCIEWEQYGTKKYKNPMPQNPKAVTKVHRKRYCENGFMETPQFWDNLFDVGEKMGKYPQPQRSNRLTECLQQVNQKLPANVYIPFFKDQIRLFTILCIWKGRIFATKERAPFSIWVQLYREQEQLNLVKMEQIEEEYSVQGVKKKTRRNILSKILQTISKPFSISGQKNTLNIKRFITEKISVLDQSFRFNKSKKMLMSSFGPPESERKQEFSQIIEDKYEYISKSERASRSSLSSSNQERVEPELHLQDFFGPNSEEHIQEMKNRSIYRELKSWRVIHLMVKTGDDIKQEQFAMQLINRFQYVFKNQKLDCVVFPYEVISLGADCGLIEMLNNVTTLNGLFQKLHSRRMNLRQFFDKVFPNPVEARRNFMRSLAGYSILTYFLQVKDRHNGNILINRQGYIIHIDFGFFLSNAPGRGVELQKYVPFKLLREYVQVIGALDSPEFFQFRRLFYKGFSAILKHRESIITLVKMMYDSHGESMGCFIKGVEAIEELDNRFAITHNVQSFCYDLINSSLDNWRARWYDKFQYFLQKIYY